MILDNGQEYLKPHMILNIVWLGIFKNIILRVVLELIDTVFGIFIVSTKIKIHSQAQ